MENSQDLNDVSETTGAGVRIDCRLPGIHWGMRI
jgi:hypothetical protein